MLNFTLFNEETKKPEVMKPPKGKVAHLFDMDDTLFHHDPETLRIHVHDKEGNRVQTLTSKEFNMHNLHPDHSYDFSEFRSSDVFAQHAKPIRKMIARLKAINATKGNVQIVTARTDLDNKDKFAHHMSKYGIDINKIYVHRAGNNSDGKKKAEDLKADLIANEINTKGYKQVHLYDDSEDNLKKFLALKKQFPDVWFHAHHIQYDPKKDSLKMVSKSEIPKPPKEKNK